jgi:hypothetical protein
MSACDSTLLTPPRSIDKMMENKNQLKQRFGPLTACFPSGLNALRICQVPFGPNFINPKEIQVAD